MSYANGSIDANPKQGMPRVHPAAELFPLMSEAELDELAKDIGVNGQVHPVVFYHGQLLDGRNRWRACASLGIEPRETTYDGASPTAFVLSANLLRRHLTAAQKAGIAVEALPLFEEEAHARMLEAASRGGKASYLKGGDDPSPPLRHVSVGDDPSPKHSRDESQRAVAQAAKATGAGIKSTQQLAAVRKVAPEVFALAKEGKASVAEVKQVAALEPEARAEVMALVEREGLAPREAILAVSHDPDDLAAQLETAGNAVVRKAAALQTSAQKLSRLVKSNRAAIASFRLVGARIHVSQAYSTIGQVLRIFKGEDNA